MMGITKLCTHLQPAPPSSFQPPPNSLQHPQQYLNQNIARNWEISPNLGQKIKSCPFWLKIGTHGILEVLIPNPDLDFWNSDPKIHFWANLGPKIQKCLFCLKIGTHGISDADSESGPRFLKFWPQNPFLGKFWLKKSMLLVFLENWHAWHLDDADSYPNISFLNCQPLNLFFGKFGLEKSKLFVLPEIWHTRTYTQYLEDVDSYFDISFLKSQT